MHLLGIDIQQISIASLIIALGLLVDDPVVAGDAIKHSLAAGWQPRIAAWLGPTKLATAIMFATITNIVAYLPFLTLPRRRRHVHLQRCRSCSACSLVASRIVSMTFIPLLGYCSCARPSKEPPIARTSAARAASASCYYPRRRLGDRSPPAACSALSLVLLARRRARRARALKTAFFPQGPVVPVVRRRLAARGRAARRDPRQGDRGRAT